MVLKLICCHVEPDKRQAFSTAQSGWLDTRQSPGFIGQWGGWEIGQSHLARILSFWNTQADLDRFMIRDHDRIQNANGQHGTYSSIHVQIAHGQDKPSAGLPEATRFQPGQQSYCSLSWIPRQQVIPPDNVLHFTLADGPDSNLYVQFYSAADNFPAIDPPRITIQLDKSWTILAHL